MRERGGRVKNFVQKRRRHTLQQDDDGIIWERAMEKERGKISSRKAWLNKARKGEREIFLRENTIEQIMRRENGKGGEWEAFANIFYSLKKYRERRVERGLEEWSDWSVDGGNFRPQLALEKLRRMEKRMRISNYFLIPSLEKRRRIQSEEEGDIPSSLSFFWYWQMIPRVTPSLPLPYLSSIKYLKYMRAFSTVFWWSFSGCGRKGDHPRV